MGKHAGACFAAAPATGNSGSAAPFGGAELSSSDGGDAAIGGLGDDPLQCHGCCQRRASTADRDRGDIIGGPHCQTHTYVKVLSHMATSRLEANAQEMKSTLLTIAATCRERRAGSPSLVSSCNGRGRAVAKLGCMLVCQRRRDGLEDTNATRVFYETYSAVGGCKRGAHAANERGAQEGHAEQCGLCHTLARSAAWRRRPRNGCMRTSARVASTELGCSDPAESCAGPRTADSAE